MGNRTREHGALQGVPNGRRVPHAGHGQRRAVSVVLRARRRAGAGRGRAVRQQRAPRREPTAAVRRPRADHGGQDQRPVDGDIPRGAVSRRSRQRHGSSQCFFFSFKVPD